MKKLVLLAMLVSGAASAQDAYVMFKGSPATENVSADRYIYVLFKNKPCKLPIADAPYMHKAAIFNTQNPDIGCWGKTLDASNAEVLIVSPYGHKSTAALTEFYSATLDKDGTGHIKGRAMSFDEYFNNIKKSQHRTD
ncbi:hypothetical protein [Burkholderia cenocepacia]|uniref:hypothetical protein n=1 Tax=Burkholderia cenocepacia TaxID=95486 RepID=UPI002AC35D68|nr:hypothetical protein [Burkholderia cenocepacia]